MGETQRGLKVLQYVNAYQATPTFKSSPKLEGRERNQLHCNSPAACGASPLKKKDNLVYCFFVCVIGVYYDKTPPLFEGAEAEKKLWRPRLHGILKSGTKLCSMLKVV